jgi:hypothetical protein
MPTANSSASKEVVTAALLVIGSKILSGRTKDQNVSGEHNQRVPEPIYIRLGIWGVRSSNLFGRASKALNLDRLLLSGLNSCFHELSLWKQERCAKARWVLTRS